MQCLLEPANRFIWSAPAAQSTAHRSISEVSIIGISLDALYMDPFDLVQRNLLLNPVVEQRGARRLVPRLLRDPRRSARTP